MSEQEVKEVLLDLMGALLNLRKELKKQNTEDEDDEDDQTQRKLKKALKKDFHGFFKWALDMNPEDSIRHNQVAPRWRELHPDLPIPRSALLKKDCDAGFSLFVMDAYPLYLMHQGRIPSPKD